jgi:hypothetical protein
VDIDPSGNYSYRYCYETEAQAREALQAWTDEEHPGGPWIKCKGFGRDILNPNFGTEEVPRP